MDSNGQVPNKFGWAARAGEHSDAPINGGSDEQPSAPRRGTGLSPKTGIKIDHLTGIKIDHLKYWAVLSGTVNRLPSCCSSSEARPDTAPGRGEVQITTNFFVNGYHLKIGDMTEPPQYYFSPHTFASELRGLSTELKGK
jgi:hypothetical protein